MCVREREESHAEQCHWTFQRSPLGSLINLYPILWRVADLARLGWAGIEPLTLNIRQLTRTRWQCQPEGSSLPPSLSRSIQWILISMKGSWMRWLAFAFRVSENRVRFRFGSADSRMEMRRYFGFCSAPRRHLLMLFHFPLLNVYDERSPWNISNF